MDGNVGLMVLEQHMYGTFHVWFFEFILGSIGALCKYSDGRTFKRLLHLQFSSTFTQNFVEGIVIREEYKLLVICQILKI